MHLGRFKLVQADFG